MRSIAETYNSFVYYNKVFVGTNIYRMLPGQEIGPSDERGKLKDEY
ncbi:MAG: hypothetical protein GDA56_13625 [Hormoscilla sp. GM7CHS1pb]|nr:hypothetical protein [Hormoscilla sp. GM7CHS1pb]